MTRCSPDVGLGRSEAVVDHGLDERVVYDAVVVVDDDDAVVVVVAVKRGGCSRDGHLAAGKDGWVG